MEDRAVEVARDVEGCGRPEVGGVAVIVLDAPLKLHHVRLGG